MVKGRMALAKAWNRKGTNKVMDRGIEIVY